MSNAYFHKWGTLLSCIIFMHVLCRIGLTFLVYLIFHLLQLLPSENDIVISGIIFLPYINYNRQPDLISSFMTELLSSTQKHFKEQAKYVQWHLPCKFPTKMANTYNVVSVIAVLSRTLTRNAFITNVSMIRTVHNVAL